MAKLEGPDIDIEISLKEYGIAWEIGEKETRFYYGTKHNGGEYTGFDWADLKNNVDFDIEFDWVDLLEVANFVGELLPDWHKLPMDMKIEDLISYYGYENIFGSSYTEPMAYEEVTKEKI